MDRSYSASTGEKKERKYTKKERKVLSVKCMAEVIPQGTIRSSLVLNLRYYSKRKSAKAKRSFISLSPL